MAQEKGRPPGCVCQRTYGLQEKTEVCIKIQVKVVIMIQIRFRNTFYLCCVIGAKSSFIYMQCFIPDPDLVQEHLDVLLLPAGPEQGQSREV